MISVAKLMARMKRGGRIGKRQVQAALHDEKFKKNVGLSAGILGAGGLGTAGGYGLASYNMDLDKTERECLPRRR